MSYSFTEKKRIRKSFSKTSNNYEIPDLLKIQLQAYEDFLQKDISPDKRKNQGLQAAFNSIFPIEGTKKSAELQFVSYSIDEPIFSVKECLMRGLTYSASLKAKLRLVLLDKNSKTRKVKAVLEDEVYFSTVPLMTEKASFVINGTERVVVSQLHRSPGVIFESDKGRTYRGKTLFTARIIPYRGSWLDFEFDQNDSLFVRIDCKKKLPLSVFLRCLGYNNEQMIHDFSTIVKVTIDPKTKAKTEVGVTADLDLNMDYLQGEILTFDIKAGDEVIVKAGSRITARTIAQIKKSKINKLTVPLDYLLNHVFAKDIVDKSTGEVMVQCNQPVDEASLGKLINAGIKTFDIAYFNDSDCNSFMSSTLNIDSTHNRDEALIAIYRVIRPGEIPTLENAEILFENLFKSEERYDLSEIGRMKLNRRLGRDTVEGSNLLSNDDIVDVIKNLISIRLKNDLVDDIDTLNNRRIRSVGEMAENQFRSGLYRVERVVRERLNNAELEGYTPKDLINSKPMTSAFREFFSTNQLSQFMDQVNPLAEVTHKRRVSAFGVGGLSRERAGFEVRDVHPSHYGRLCPVETPEGPNIGLINSLALYSSTNQYGFLETQFRKVVKAKLTDEIVVLSSIDEADYVIAQANTETDKNGKIIGNLISCRKNGEVGLYHPDDIDLIDISPRQVFSAATALIPFLEHDDANRALMGSNMQRQAVPLLRSEKPLVGTGMERSVALNSRVCIVAERSGEVLSTDASRIVVKVDASQVEKGQSGVDIYNLEKYTHSNQNTCINQIPLVKVGDQISKGDVLADSSATDIGELALGKNVLVAFMPWNGYNFEDSILISEKLVAKESYTSIHIEEFVVYARDTRLGSEEITNDIPNVSESALAKLDNVGIIRVGAEVTSGDILVGKVTPKGESSLNPEEKLLRAIFGEKASEVKDTSLRAKSDMRGTVIDVRIYTRSNDYKDERCLEIEAEELALFRKDLDEKLDIMKEDLISQVKAELLGKTLKKSIKNGAKAKETITKAVLKEISESDLFSIETTDKATNDFVANIHTTINSYKKKSDELYKDQCKKVQDPCDLPTGVIKAVKVSIAVKKHLQPGDKMAGRHGNKGVISRIWPVEDMPYTDDGRTVDVVLNPLGVPSRMNVGQVLEVHLGFAAKELGHKIDEMLRRNKNTQEVKAYLQEIYNMGSKQQSIADLNEKEIQELAHNLKDGVPVETPIFDGATESEIKSLLKFAGLPESGQVTLYDGTTGDAFDNPVTIGYMYMLKLNHLADDKMHARATGPYSLVTQQPLGGKAHYGGQRFGEMEVWALEAYGASHILQEMLTVKSDDTVGRSITYRNIVNQNYDFEARVPESFNVLVKEIQALALDIDLREDLEH